MLLKLLDDAGNTVTTMNDNEAPLGAYSPYDFYTIHIVDMDPSTVNFDNVEDVPKYSISEDSYNSRTDTFRKFKEHLSQENSDLFSPPEVEIFNDYMEEVAVNIRVGQRCRLNPGDKRGVIQYVGKVPEAQPGYFIGIELDEPLGKNNGSVKGKQYFECAPKYGVFVRPNVVDVGDFPPIDEDEV